jgi:hypothetical protein
MEIELVESFFFWCSVINLGILTWWFLVFVFAKRFIYKLHGMWFKIDDVKFDAIHYRAMAYYKLGIFLLNLVPYFALKIV